MEHECVLSFNMGWRISVNFIPLLLLGIKYYYPTQGRIQGGGGGAPSARAPPKIEKKKIFWRKIVIFHTKYPKYFRASLRNWKKYDFLS
jgi:hypothetical protein